MADWTGLIFDYVNQLIMVHVYSRENLILLIKHQYANKILTRICSHPYILDCHYQAPYLDVNKREEKMQEKM